MTGVLVAIAYLGACAIPGILGIAFVLSLVPDLQVTWSAGDPNYLPSLTERLRMFLAAIAGGQGPATIASAVAIVVWFACIVAATRPPNTERHRRGLIAVGSIAFGLGFLLVGMLALVKE